MRSNGIAVFLSLSFLTAWTAFAAPPNSVVLDGRPYEYDDMEWRGANMEAPHWGPDNVIDTLYITWDETYLYVMLQGHVRDNKLVLMMDVDPDMWTGATTTTNWVFTGEPYIDYNDVGWVAAGGMPFGLDYMLSSEGTFNKVIRVLYDNVAAPDVYNTVKLFGEGNGNRPTGGEIDMVTQADATACTLKGFEARIPWTEIYTGDGRFGFPGAGGVPIGATLRVFANLHNNRDNNVYSSSNAIPEQIAGFWVDGILTTDTYIDVVVDGDHDGVPDVAPGDVNGPFICDVIGADGRTQVFLSFNEAATAGTAGDSANYFVDGATPGSVNILSPTLVELNLTSPLPAEGAAVWIQSVGIEDASGNSKINDFCFIVGPPGIDFPVAVTFVLNTNSGFAVNGGATEFFLNSGTFPLREGFPPATSTPLAWLSGDLFSVDVTFPAGTSSQVGYRYSGILNGTNNYEAIRLDNYAFQTRWLDLNDSGLPMTVTDYLGAAASPLRQGESGYVALYDDPHRGDAGVRERITVLLQLDLYGRDLGNIDRVLVQGTDPLRGFNAADYGVPDWAGDPSVGWDVGGLTLNDDGSNGDLMPGDSIWSREWVWSINGTDATAEPDLPNSLVGGSWSTLPYGGWSGWTDARSPRSFSYKFYLVDAETNWFESPSANIDYYIHDGEGTYIEIPPLVWGNDDVPKMTAANPAVILDIIPSGEERLIVYSNIEASADNAIEMADEPAEIWQSYGLEGQGHRGSPYTATVENAASDSQVFRVVTPSREPGIVWWTPAPIVPGETVRIHYNQNRRILAGEPSPKLASSLNGWDGGSSPMTFTSNGNWYIDVAIPPGQTNAVEFKINTAPKSPTAWDGNTNGKYPDGNYGMDLAGRGVSWTPEQPVPGEQITVSYDATERILQGAADVYIRYGFDNWDGSPWSGGGDALMTSNALLNEWVFTFDVPTNFSKTVNFVFYDDWGTWDNNDGHDWAAFIEQ